jgi:hypothetical protein
VDHRHSVWHGVLYQGGQKLLLVSSLQLREHGLDPIELRRVRDIEYRYYIQPTEGLLCCIAGMHLEVIEEKEYSSSLILLRKVIEELLELGG